MRNILRQILYCAITLAIPAFAMAQAPPTPGEQAEPRVGVAQGVSYQTLWPGDSTELYGVKVAWQTSQSSEDTTGAGKLLFTGKEGSATWTVPPQLSVSSYHTAAYVDEVIIYAQAKADHNSTVTKRIDLTAELLPATITSGAPIKRDYWVSAVQPLRLGKMEVGVTTEILTQADGSRQLEIYFRKVDGSVEQMPAVPGAVRTIGRWFFRVGKAIQTETKCVSVAIEAAPEYTIRGLDTYTTGILFPSGVTYRDSLEQLARDYAFTIEWVDDNSSEAETVKQQVLDKSFFSGDGLVRTAVQRSFESSFDKQIVSPELVRISVKESAKADVRKKAAAEIAKKQARGIFDAQFTPQTHILSLQHVSPDAAVELLKQELNTYLLIEDPNQIGPFANVELDAPYRVVENRFGQSLSGGLAHSIESVMADEKGRLVILNAVPSKVPRLKKLIADLDAAIAGTAKSEETTEPARLYKVEMILLQGGKAGRPVDGAPTGSTEVYDPKVPAKYGITPDDLEMFGFDAAAELGRGLVTVMGETNDLGQSRTRLTPTYSGDLTFKAVREPYVILQARLSSVALEGGLLENSVYLEPGKPTVLGVTNMKQALILILKLH